MKHVSSALTKEEAVAQLQRASNKEERHKHERTMLEAGLARKAVVSMSAAGMGALQRHGTPNDIKGFPWKLGLWTVATVVEVIAKPGGYLQAVAAGVSDSTMAVYVHDAVAKGTLVAGNGGGELAA
jgi:hypothetical protein